MDDKTLYNTKAKEYIAQCTHIIKAWKDYDNFELNTSKLDWSPKRISSRGGWYDGPGINIAMCIVAMPRLTPYRMYEYKSFDKDPLIGGFYSCDRFHPLYMHIVHEMAHAAQYYADRILGVPIDRPHGESFKIPYRKLRISTLNKVIPINQLQLKAEYEQEIKTIIAGFRHA